MNEYLIAIGGSSNDKNSNEGHIACAAFCCVNLNNKAVKVKYVPIKRELYEFSGLVAFIYSLKYAMGILKTDPEAKFNFALQGEQDYLQKTLTDWIQEWKEYSSCLPEKDVAVYRKLIAYLELSWLLIDEKNKALVPIDGGLATVNEAPGDIAKENSDCSDNASSDMSGDISGDMSGDMSGVLINSLGQNPVLSPQLPMFKQWDERWAKQPYAYSRVAYRSFGDFVKSWHDTTIKVAGCGPVCMAMINCWAKGKLTLPTETAQYAAENGFHKLNVGTLHGFFDAFAKTQGYSMKNTTDRETIMNALKVGIPVVTNHGPGKFTKTGHFVVYAGFHNDGSLIVYDPNRINPDEHVSVDEAEASRKQAWIPEGEIGPMYCKNNSSYILRKGFTNGKEC